MYYHPSSVRLSRLMFLVLVLTVAKSRAQITFSSLFDELEKNRGGSSRIDQEKNQEDSLGIYQSDSDFRYRWECSHGDGRSGCRHYDCHRRERRWDCNREDACSWGKCPIPISSVALHAEVLWERLLAFAATFEVLARGFTLGFGLRMLQYLFLKPCEDRQDRKYLLTSFRRKALVSAVSGLSLAAFLHGSSIFFPASVRRDWFDYSAPDRTTATIPPVLFEHVRQRVERSFQGDAGDSDCPADEIDFEWPAYFWRRVATGLLYMANTLEVLFRGFSLGFGARMLKFLFFPDDEDDRRKSGLKESDFEGTSDEEGTKREKSESNDADALVESFRYRALVSAASGISVAAAMHGSSLFIPTEIRKQWFAF